MLAFALNAIAHVTHRHDAAPTPTSIAQTLACGYCISFGGLADAPRHAHAVAVAEPAAYSLVPTPVIHVSLRPQTSAHPRAPPVS
jgi:hypothetical protein